MTVSSGFKGSGAKELKTEWPIEEGLELGTTKRKEDDTEPEETYLSKSDLARMS